MHCFGRLHIPCLCVKEKAFLQAKMSFNKIVTSLSSFYYTFSSHPCSDNMCAHDGNNLRWLKQKASFFIFIDSKKESKLNQLTSLVGFYCATKNKNKSQTRTMWTTSTNETYLHGNPCLLNKPYFILIFFVCTSSNKCGFQPFFVLLAGLPTNFLWSLMVINNAAVFFFCSLLLF